MICYDLKCDSFDPRELSINENELRARLGCSPSDIDSLPALISRLKNVARPRYVCRYTDIARGEGSISLGFGDIVSRDLEKNLSGCDTALVFAVTLGADADRYLLKLSKISPSEHYITDAIASSLAESFCDRVEELIVGNMPHRPRYSIGYGDLSLEHQRPLLGFLNAEKTVGITLTDDLLMTPIKSITAIVGIKK